MPSPHVCVLIGFFFTLGSAVCATLALILRPFAAHRASGRRFARQSVAFGLLALPLHLCGAPGTNVADHVYAVGLTPLILCVVAILIYPRPRQTPTRGVKVISPPAAQKDSETSGDA